MPKKLIKKYQFPSSGLNFEGGNLTQQGINESIDFNNQLLKATLNPPKIPKLNVGTIGTSKYFKPKSNGIFSKANTANTANAANTASTASIASSASDIVGGFIPTVEDGTASNAVLKGMDTIGDIGFNPQLMAATGGLSAVVGAGLKVGSLVGKGINYLGQSKIGASDTDLSKNIIGYGAENTQAATVGGLSKLFGSGKSRVRTLRKRKDAVETDNTKKLFVSNQERQNSAISTNTFEDTFRRNQNALQGGLNTNMLVAKLGGRLNIKNVVAKVNYKKIGGTLDRNKKEMDEESPAFNVIPSGALHAHKHNLDLDVTSKGIPVVTLEEGGEIDEQHAEIERDEIILHLSLSKKLEKLQKDFESAESKKEKDTIALEAGKLLASEIMENTEDNTNLIETV